MCRARSSTSEEKARREKERIENEERDKHYVGADDSNLSLTDVPSTSLQKPIVHNAMSATPNLAARYLTEDMLVRIKEAVDTDEKACVPDLLGSQYDGTCSIVHDQISWALGMGITLYGPNMVPPPSSPTL